MVAAGWSEAQKRAYALADNKLALNAGWDEALLALEIERAAGARIRARPDWLYRDRAMRHCSRNATDGLTDPDDVPELPADPGVASRRCLAAGPAPAAVRRQHVGSRRRTGCSLACSPHLMVTDPPYGVSYDPAWRKRAGLNHDRTKLGKVANDDRADWREAWALFPGSVAYVWHAGRYASTCSSRWRPSGFEMRAQIIWAKDRFALSRGHYHWQHEPCWYAVRRAPGALDRRPQAVDALARSPAREEQGYGHGTQKPVECMRRPIENNSSPGPGGLRAVQRLGHHHHRGRDDRPLLPCASSSIRPMSMSPSSAGRRSPARPQRWRATARSFDDVAAERQPVKEPRDGPPRTHARSRAAPPGRGHGGLRHSGRRYCAVVSIDPKTLRKHYRDELDLGADQGQRAGGRVPVQLPPSNGNVTAQIFWLKTRARWKEPANEFKHSGSLGTYDMTKVSDADLARLEFILAPVADAGANQGGTGST